MGGEVAGSESWFGCAHLSEHLLEVKLAGASARDLRAGETGQHGARTEQTSRGGALTLPCSILLATSLQWPPSLSCVVVSVFGQGSQTGETQRVGDWLRTFVWRDEPELLLELSGHARAPVDHGAKDVEYEGLHALEGMRRCRHRAETF